MMQAKKSREHFSSKLTRNYNNFSSKIDFRGIVLKKTVDLIFVHLECIGKLNLPNTR